DLTDLERESGVGKWFRHRVAVEQAEIAASTFVAAVVRKITGDLSEVTSAFDATEQLRDERLGFVFRTRRARATCALIRDQDMRGPNPREPGVFIRSSGRWRSIHGGAGCGLRARCAFG